MSIEEKTAKEKKHSAAVKRRKTADKKILSNHPELEDVWAKFPPQTELQCIEQPIGLKLKLLPYQLEGLNWLIRQEKDFKGGLLADEMGLGKTISMISLILAVRRKPVLVVAPAVAVLQWKSEIETHVSDKLSIYVFHGTRINDPLHLALYDVIITTYSIVESSFRREKYGFNRYSKVIGTSKHYEPSALHAVMFERIILDECHYIKERSTNTARAVFALRTSPDGARWCLSGTPIQNRVGELYSIIRFLKLDPFGLYFCMDCECRQETWQFTGGKQCDHCGHKPMRHFCFWNREILRPIQNGGSNSPEGRQAYEKLQILFSKYMLRRTKTEKADELGLPPRKVRVREYKFNEHERDLYRALYSDSKLQFDSFVAKGTVLNNYANVFELLIRMRQAANHPDLFVSKMYRNSGLECQHVCGICHDFAEDPVVAAKCKHVFCRADARDYIESAVDAVKCPVCFGPFDVDLEGLEIIVEKPRGSTILETMDMNSWRSSTKIEALFEELSRLRNENHSVKSIVFSQFVSFLDLCHWRLKRAGFNCVKLDGRMSMEQRNTVIATFTTSPHVNVFLISLKAGGVALNLTAASQVFLMDPWWNPAAEDQAMDRIHRLGQHRPIQVTRFVISDSIEERILQLQEKKKAVFDSTVGGDLEALARLSEEDLEFLFSL